MITIILFIISYLLGAIPAGLWIGKLFFHKNLHEFGSGNTGTTNTFRTLGVKAGIVVFLFDLLKGTLAVLLPTFFHLHSLPVLIFGLFAVLGHTFSIFDHFHGGKAVATSAGVLLGYRPLFLLLLLFIFILVLYLFSMISLSSIVAAVVAFIGAAVFPAFHFTMTHYDPIFTIIVMILAGIILFRHHSNIKRIKNRNESVVPWGLNLTHQHKI